MKYAQSIALGLIILCSGVKAQDKIGFSERDVKLLKGVEYRYGMLKWNVGHLTLGALDLAYERRFNLNFSGVVRNSITWNQYRKGYLLSVGARYYVNLEKRILKNLEKGQNTPCFNATYVQFDAKFQSRNGTDHIDDRTNGSSAGPALTVGFQRRFWKYAYVDANAGAQFLPGIDYYFSGMFAIGVGL